MSYNQCSNRLVFSSHPFHSTDLKLIAAHFNYFANVDIELFPGGLMICHPKEQGGNLKVVPHNERHGVLRVKVRLWAFHNSSCQLTPTARSVCLGEEKFENLIVEPVVAEKGQGWLLTQFYFYCLLFTIMARCKKVCLVTNTHSRCLLVGLTESGKIGV